MLLRMSKNVNIDIRPLFHFWGFPPINSTTLGNSIQAANLPASRVIYDTLVRYKSLVPPDNATFRTFANGWWGKQPLSTGFSEERYHAARWDSYDAAMATATAARAQAIIDLYFPTGRPSDYGDWRSQWATANLLDPQADLDGDGMSNDHERIWGLDPTDATVQKSDPFQLRSEIRQLHLHASQPDAHRTQLHGLDLAESERLDGGHRRTANTWRARRQWRPDGGDGPEPRTSRQPHPLHQDARERVITRMGRQLLEDE